MKAEKTSKETEKLLNTLKTICEPYGFIPEIVTNYRRKYNPTLEEYQQGLDNVYDPSKWDPKEVGLVVILRENIPELKRDNTKFGGNVNEVKKRILNSNLGIAGVLIELAQKR